MVEVLTGTAIQSQLHTPKISRTGISSQDGFFEGSPLLLEIQCILRIGKRKVEKRKKEVEETKRLVLDPVG